jgi:hypothetical protein
MSPKDDSIQHPKRRGRPRKRQPAAQTPPQAVTPRAAEPLPASSFEQSADEQLAYTIAEEHISVFSSLLRHILRPDRMEIARVAKELDIAENTIYRWMNGNSEPRPMYLKGLLEAMPEHRNDLTDAINQTFPGVLDSLETGICEVQKELYRRVLELVTTTPELDARRWQIPQVIFEYALLHLDSERRGLAITYAKLMPARADGIHSLCEATMRGNYPWPFALENHGYLGSTTLAGAAAIFARMQTWDNLSETERLQFEVDEFERSACAYPVLRGGRIVGVLIVSSTQPGFFSNPIACQAVIEYAQLLSLAFHEEEFYPFSALSLRPMPDLKWQRAEVGRSYLNRIINYAHKMGISRQEAEVRVRSDMELEFEEFERLQHERHNALSSPTEQHSVQQRQE